MRTEINSAVDFLSNLLRTRVALDRVENFRQYLNNSVTSHYEGHWFPEKPFKGSGYRCIRINHKMDPLIKRAGIETGITESVLFSILPNELTLWVDPDEVSYRIGEDGSIGVLYDSTGKLTAQTEEDDEEYNSSSSTSSSPPPTFEASSDSDSASSHSSSPVEFLQSCNNQLRYYLPESSESNLEYLATTFVAS